MKSVRLEEQGGGESGREAGAEDFAEPWYGTRCELGLDKRPFLWQVYPAGQTLTRPGGENNASRGIEEGRAK